MSSSSSDGRDGRRRRRLPAVFAAMCRGELPRRIIPLTESAERRLRHTIATMGLSGKRLDAETIGKLRAVAAGLMTSEEYVAWVKECARRNGEISDPDAES